MSVQNKQNICMVIILSGSILTSFVDYALLHENGNVHNIWYLTMSITSDSCCSWNKNWIIINSVHIQFNKKEKCMVVWCHLAVYKMEFLVTVCFGLYKNAIVLKMKRQVQHYLIDSIHKYLITSCFWAWIWFLLFLVHCLMYLMGHLRTMLGSNDSTRSGSWGLHVLPV